MLAAEGLLKALSADESYGDACKNYNNDTDFGSVLDFYGEESSMHGGMIRYSDGTEKEFTFNN
ncbi:MAG: hypothetical protein NC180_05470 [Muribaculaceae bacterium]|nr:hypothetical protein [Roseburia sp.]MCM1430550.1 hypothetical protein [Muribaculaceae bacterium]MCM1492657.1 hypothetical protein [Muribaculaceae bacterium]